MFINYYFVQGCTYSTYHGKNVIFAPDGTPEDLLHQYNFQKAEDGRYFRILTEKEYEAVMKGYPDNNVTFSYENSQPIYDNPHYRNVPHPDFNAANIVCILSLLLLIAGLCIIFIVKKYFLLALGLIIGGQVLAIFVKIRYPENLFGKILFVLFIILYVLFVIAVILLISACIQCINSCNNCNIPG